MQEKMLSLRIFCFQPYVPTLDRSYYLIQLEVDLSKYQEIQHTLLF